ncbi:MAG TPA: hypothetical protein VGV59_07145 [Pyrinomonadaceae bacterium]|nr:hypothetical protein [Pyrinomonadaceae bacterium]
MKSQDSPSHRQRRALALVVLISFLALCVASMASSAAQPGQDKAVVVAKEKREIKERIPAHLPIKVKIKNPEKVKDSKNEDWLADLEVEVTNMGTKPIYYLYIALSLPDVITDNGNNVGYILRYGRIQFTDLKEPVRPDDVPLLPGAATILKVPADRIRAWKSLRANGTLTNPKKLTLSFQFLSFGDGTALWTPEGIRLPKTKEQSYKSSCGESEKWSIALADSPPSYIPDIASTSSLLPSPVNNLPANVFRGRIAIEPSAAADICCPGTAGNCSHLKIASANCICGEVEIAQSASSVPFSVDTTLGRHIFS